MTDEEIREADGRPEPAPEPLVTLIKPGEGDVTYAAADGPIRFVEGRAEGVPLSVARKLAGPGWWIEKPRKKLAKGARR